MDATKYAWQILHAMIRRRVAADEGHDFHPQLARICPLWRAATDDKGVAEFEVVLELARFGALFAEMTGNDTLAMAADIGRDVMAQPDEEDED